MKQRDDDTPAPGACPALVSLKGLNFDYREGSRSRRVLQGLDLEVARGQCVAIMGRSGSGKSTLLNLISGIDLPTSGRIVIQGMDLSAMDERRRTLFRRRHIGFIYQFFNLLPTLTVRENILLPLELNGLPRVRADEMLRAVALETRADSFPDSLSGGEQQRVAIARALAHEPLLLLADEPTGNLDQEGGTEALALLERLVRRAGHSLILVTHSTEAAAIADRILLLRDGHLIERQET
ncbi:MAG: ABC transporter ATP-binding protein [Gammaproteobacteria bacterium]